MYNMKSLAIEREFGSGGREVGMKVAEMAGIPYYDTDLLIKAAEKYGISVGQILDYDEKGILSAIKSFLVLFASTIAQIRFSGTSS